ncbi:MAG TPA: hypothetical protein VHA56_04935 [Mucilaginibacter sp.]|nr:hypothetical protein [Mucilaginibacter sp.]
MTAIKKKIGMVIAVTVTGLSFFGFVTRQENQPPVVRIVNPKNNGVYRPGGQVNYEISVADKEDGDTKYDEINAKEVLLKVQYVKNKARIKQIIGREKNADPVGFITLRQSDCFNCHNYSSKAMGPSFREIAIKYPASGTVIDSLAGHIRTGCSGRWGKEIMPAHPGLTEAAAKIAVQWILKNAKDTTINYYTGTTGIFRAAPANKIKGAYILTASYMDHGLKTSNAAHLRGQDNIVLSEQ